MFGSGEVDYHLTYIDDLVDGILLLAERPEALGETFLPAGYATPASMSWSGWSRTPSGWNLPGGACR